MLDHLYHPSNVDPAVPVDSYWRATADPMRHPTPAVEAGVDCDVAVIGGGYTGLWAALRLARDYTMDVRVLDAAEPAWGASGRNGGFCSVGASKLSFAQMARRYGDADARAFTLRQLDGIAQVRAFLEDTGTDAMVHSNGEVCLAHRPRLAAALRDDARHRTEQFGCENLVLDRADLAAHGLAGPEFHAGRITRWGFALHPLRYARALADAAADAGARLHGCSAVTEWRQDAGRHVLRTARGEVRARKVVVATNGYSTDRIPPWMRGRYLPVMSAIIVTRPLTEAERAAQGWTSDLMAYDTRKLLHYFRLMPDGRFLFGGRAHVAASPSGRAATRQRLVHHFHRMFPAWAGVGIDHFWTGFVCLTRDLVPYLGPIEGVDNAWAGFAYHGNGVAMGSWTGARLAGLVAGDAKESSAIPAPMRGPSRPFPLPGLRIAYLRAMAMIYAARDAMP